jgi:TetR/AcrR family transcriptional repressor of nem operon
MTRPKSFDERQALGAARELFWSKGFGATSMSDLTAATGVGRQSLYDTFGSKEDLFAAALRDYLELELTPILTAFEERGSLRAQLTLFFDRVIEVMLRRGGRGCFLTNTVAEKDVVGAGVVAVIDHHSAAIEAQLKRVVRAAQRRGEIPQAQPAAATAAYLFNTVLGLSASARLQCGRKRLREIVGLALDAIAPAATEPLPDPARRVVRR